MLTCYTDTPLRRAALQLAHAHLQRQGAHHACLWVETLADVDPFEPLDGLKTIILNSARPGTMAGLFRWQALGWVVQPFNEAPPFFDAYIIGEYRNLHRFMRGASRYMAANKIVVPADIRWLVSDELRTIDPHSLCVGPRQYVPAAYLERANLRGAYLEFGTFCGVSFSRNYHAFRHYLKDFYAFDSFAGLSQPMADEETYSFNDFKEGEYFCNEVSFRIIMDMAEVSREHLKIVPGFFQDSLRGKNPALYGLQPRSVSCAVIDCDLYEPTYDVLNFISPLLDDGALLYFDDWFLTRASPRLGERGAALRWLRENPHFELVDFHQTAWQNRFFIFHRLD